MTKRRPWLLKEVSVHSDNDIVYLDATYRDDHDSTECNAWIECSGDIMTTLNRLDILIRQRLGERFSAGEEWWMHTNRKP